MQKVATKHKLLFFKIPVMTRPRMTGINEILGELWYVQHNLNRGNLLLNMSVANFLRTLYEYSSSRACSLKYQFRALGNVSRDMSGPTVSEASRCQGSGTWCYNLSNLLDKYVKEYMYGSGQNKYINMSVSCHICSRRLALSLERDDGEETACF